VVLPTPRVKAFAAVAAVCLVAAGASFFESYRAEAGQRHLVPARTSPVAVTTPPATTLATSPLPVAVARPVQVDIPAVGLSAPVVPVGLNVAGQMVMPNPSVAGWYRLGPAPGAVGPAVIVGHVDTYKGAAVFYQLTAVRVGEEIVVVRADGGRSRFVITAVTVVRKAVFPTQDVFAPTPTASIRLITCTGTFDLRSRHYVDSLIVWGVAAS
jgi:hypothetical protein